MSFSDRMEIDIPQPKITIRNEAPQELRIYLLQIMQEYEGLKLIRRWVCLILKEAEDPNNWAENKFMKSEIQSLLLNCPWYKIYDIIEYFYEQTNYKEDFEKSINEYFIDKGIGWKLVHGNIETRGEQVFEHKVTETVDLLGRANLQTSQNEIKEALKDMSKRPSPDLTGAVQHSVAALECLSREITGDKSTLGALITNNPNIVPAPLDKSIHAVFGFASNYGRHLKEGNNPKYEETELVVHLCATLCSYLVKKNFPKKQDDDDLPF